MNKPKKEPVKNGKIWIVFGLLLAVITPWYFPTGSYKPLIFGIPYWAFIIIGGSFLLSAFVTYVLKNHWQLEEDDEEEAK
ncbi:hypothetical protein MUN89_20435 [Halobacillus salinarum]|uniref:DUF3311 domain-containing protein n=1 Tax=Halobacillus salinarum TaxID=2932257 RepID=A0ABY4EK05_9BACI|nr:hypothetical protein [Halobacillus salinarum]UOQ44193.1 hypothetical protein MUN89_20435 [Halobacillus salinarum]